MYNAEAKPLTLSIVHIDTSRTWRGGQQALLILARGLRARGHAQTIACPADSALAERARAQQFTVAPLEGAAGFRRLVRSGGFQIVHAHSGRAQNLAALATVGLPVRRAVTRHVAFTPGHPLVHRLKYNRTCHGIIAVSESVRQVLLGAGIAPEKIQVIHTGIELPASPPTPGERAAARQQFGAGERDLVIGHMGAFTQEKGQDVAIDAAALLREGLPQARFLLAGEGALAGELRERVARVGARVSFPGFIAEAGPFFAALDLFLMPSRSEGWGLAALEAMARGVPVIASNVGGLAEIVEHGVSGWLVPPGDPAALARAIGDAASDGERLRAAGRAARERARLFSAERTAERTEAFYHRLLAE